MSNLINEKMKAVRIAEGLTQKAFADLTGISLGTVKNYETGVNGVGAHVLENMFAVERFEKYVLWIMTNKTSREAGQIAPAGWEDKPDETEDDHLMVG